MNFRLFLSKLRREDPDVIITISYLFRTSGEYARQYTIVEVGDDALHVALHRPEAEDHGKVSYVPFAAIRYVAVEQSGPPAPKKPLASSFQFAEPLSPPEPEPLQPPTITPLPPFPPSRPERGTY